MPTINYNDSAWQEVAPGSEEFLVSTPAKLALLKRTGSFKVKRDGEKVLEQRDYSAYAGDFIFVIRSYKAAHPERLLNELLGSDALIDNTLVRAVESNVTHDGFNGKQYRINEGNLYTTIQYLATLQHVYTFRVIARNEGASAAQKFLASIKLGRVDSNQHANDLIEEVNSDLDPLASNAPLSGSAVSPTPAQTKDEVLTLKETTHKPTIVWKPEPQYTETARRHQLTGTVALRVILTSSGKIRVVRAVKELGDGLTENAIKAVKCMRFFPAEKDGRLVSTYATVEFIFNLY